MLHSAELVMGIITQKKPYNFILIFNCVNLNPKKIIFKIIAI